jgi:tryptophan-rich sensory protein
MTWPLLLSICLFYGILILVNIPAPFIGLEFERDSTTRLWYQPPGFVIPVVWFILFTLLGIARYTLLQTQQPQLQGWLFGLAFVCASYAYYTLGLAKLTAISALWFGLFGNILVILLAAWVVWQLLPVSRAAALLTAPVILWTAYASLIVWGEMKLEKLVS